MDEEIHEPKIDGMEAFLMIGLCCAFDTVDFLATFLDGFFGAGEIIKFFNNIIASTTLFVWAMMKEVNPFWLLAGGGAELVPIVNSLPIRTGAMIRTVWLDWHPKQAEFVAKVTPNIKNPKRMLAGKKSAITKTPKTTQAA